MKNLLTHPGAGWAEQVETQGYAIVADVLAPDAVATLCDALAAANDAQAVRQRREVYAIRNLLEVVPEVRAIAASPAVRGLVEPILGSGAFVVRGILFDKVPDANWKVPWHQDLTIAVRERREVAGFGPWSQKAGIAHVQPPVEILERMLTVRLQLDDGGEANGPLQVIPGSHRHGRLDAAAIAWQRAAHDAVICAVPAGGALLMRPLLLHASSAAESPGHRRVVHLEFANQELPGGLDWHVSNTSQQMESGERRHASGGSPTEESPQSSQRLS